MNLLMAMCSTCGFETFVSDQSTMDAFHCEFDGAHEPYWYVNDEPYAFDVIHILSATSVRFPDEVTRRVGPLYNLTHCHAAFRYKSVSDEYVIGNYSGSRGATCPACITDYETRYGRSTQN